MADKRECGPLDTSLEGVTQTDQASCQATGSVFAPSLPRSIPEGPMLPRAPRLPGMKKQPAPCPCHPQLPLQEAAPQGPPLRQHQSHMEKSHGLGALLDPPLTGVLPHVGTPCFISICQGLPTRPAKAPLKISGP